MLGTRLTLIVVILALAGFAYMAGKHNERTSWQAKVKIAEMKRAKELRLIEAQHREKVRKIEYQAKEELDYAQQAVNSLIDQLDRASIVLEQPPSSASVSETGGAPVRVNGRAQQSIAVDKRGLSKAAGECRRCEVKLGQLQEWSRSAVEICNGE